MVGFYFLYYNIGETWVEQGSLWKAIQAYEKALGYAEGDGVGEGVFGTAGI